MAEEETTEEEAAPDFSEYEYLIPTWLKDTVLQEIWEEAYIQTGNGAQALEAVRQSAEYETFFPGNTRDDGTIRLSEGEYQSTIESYQDSIAAIGINPDLPQWDDMWVELIEGDVDGSEFWQLRVKPIYDRVLNNTAEVMAEFASLQGIALSPEAIIANAINPAIGTAILDKTMSLAEIRGEFASKLAPTSTIGGEYFEDLYKYGVDQNQARQLFGAADTMMPLLSVLAGRHQDPDDDFDIMEFTAASLYNDPEQATRLRRLMAQERASFQAAGSQLDFIRDRITGAAGLVERSKS